MKELLIALCGVLLFAGVSVAQNNNHSNEATIEQVGDHQHADVFQQGSHSAAVTQSGQGGSGGYQNRVVINQFSASSFADITQFGEYNESSVNQFGSHRTEILQQGDGNAASVWQENGGAATSGDESNAYVYQEGYDNTANIYQLGGVHLATIEQFGNNNFATIAQYGIHGNSGSEGLAGHIIQHNDANIATLEQSGHALPFTIEQTGSMEIHVVKH